MQDAALGRTYRNWQKTLKKPGAKPGLSSCPKGLFGREWHLIGLRGAVRIVD